MASLLVGDSFDIVAALCKRYVRFCTDINYYEKVVASFSNLSSDKILQKADDKVLNDIRSGFKTNNDWFISYAEEQLRIKKNDIRALNAIAALCAKWFIDVDIDTLSILVDKSKDLDNALLRTVNTVKPITISGIERITNNKLLIDILVGYASLKNILEDEKEEELDDDDEEKKAQENVYFSDDSIKLYLREIGQYPLLKPEEEKEIAFLIKAGTNVEELDEDEAKKVIKAAERAKKKLANHNLRLVVNIAKRYVGRGLDFGDVIQAGNEGLLKAVDRYDVEKGFKFSTYATWWIRQAIDRTIKDEGRTVRIPVHLHDTYFKIVKTRETLVKTYGEKVTWDDVASELGMDVDAVIEIVLNFKENISMSSPVGDEEDTEFGDFLADTKMETPEDAVIKDSLKDSLADVLSTLSQREERVIRLRFGIQDSNSPKPEYSKEHTLEEVGALFNVTRERIRQIEAKALRKLRHPTRARKLDSYYSNPSAKPKSAGSVDQDARDAKKRRKATVSAKPSKKTPIVNSPIKVIKPGDPDWTPPKEKSERLEATERYTLPSAGYKRDYKVPVIKEEEDDMAERKYTEPKYLYELLECTKEELALVKGYIDSQKELATYAALYSIFGEELDQKGSLDKLDTSQKKDFYNAISSVKARIDRLRSLGYKSLQEALGVSSEYYEAALVFLSKQPESGVLIKVHGESLGVYANTAILGRKEESIYNKLISDTRNFIKLQETRKTLKQLVNCPDDLWDDLRKALINDADLHEYLVPIFGEDLLGKENLEKIGAKEHKKYNKVLENIRAIIMKADKYKGKDLATIMGLPLENRDEVLNSLKTDSSLISLFGPELAAPLNMAVYLSMGDKDFESLINKAKNGKPKKERGATLQTTLGLTDDNLDIISALNTSLYTNSKYKATLRAAYGDDLLQGKASDVDVYNIMVKIRPRVNTAVELKNKTLYEEYSLRPSEIVRVRPKVLKAKFYDTAAKLFGADLSGKANITAYFSLDGRAYYGFTVGMNNLVRDARNAATDIDNLIDNYEGKRLEEIVGCTVEELPEVVSNARNKGMLDVLSFVHGAENEKSFTSLNPNLDFKVCKKYTEYIAILKSVYIAMSAPADNGMVPPEPPVGSQSPTDSKVSAGPTAQTLPEEPETLLPKPDVVELSSYNHPLFREAIKVVPINYRYILMLYLGLHEEGICYPIEDLMTIFNRSREEIEEALLRGKIFFDEIVAAYEKIYTSSFPTIKDPDDVARMRINE